jgi:hypothetical protein
MWNLGEKRQKTATLPFIRAATDGENLLLLVLNRLVVGSPLLIVASPSLASTPPRSRPALASSHPPARCSCMCWRLSCLSC